MSVRRHTTLCLLPPTKKQRFVRYHVFARVCLSVFRPCVGLATFNCASCVLSPYLSQPTQPRRLCMLSLHADSTTATNCCTVLPTPLFRRLQSAQNAAARLITGTRRRHHITPVLRDLHWLPVRRRVDYASLASL